MTAVMYTHTPTELAIDRVSESIDAAFTSAELHEFLHDPIGYGDFDFADPITLGEFLCHGHVHGHFRAVLA